jgi:hypothetical protein
MAPCPDYPWINTKELADPQEAAKIMVASYLAGLEAYEVCEAKRQALIDWINNGPL